MEHLRLFLLRLCLILTLSSITLAAVTPREHAFLSAVKRVSKHAQHLSQSVSHVHKTIKPRRNLPSKALLEHLGVSLLRSLRNDRKERKNTLGTTVDASSAGTTLLQLSFRQSGLNFDRCSDDSDCASTRQCILFTEDQFFLCNSAENCFCLREGEDLSCSSNSDCDEGESCAPFGEDGPTLCISDDIIGGTGAENSPDSGSDDDGSGSGAPSSGGGSSSSSDGDGLNFDRCSDDSDCASARQCILFTEDQFFLCNSAENCFCLREGEDLSCSSNSDCDEGESCAPFGEDGPTLCISDDIIGGTGAENSPDSGSDDDGSGSGTPSSGGGSTSVDDEDDPSSEQPASDGDPGSSSEDSDSLPETPSSEGNTDSESDSTGSDPENGTSDASGDDDDTLSGDDDDASSSGDDDDASSSGDDDDASSSGDDDDASSSGDDDDASSSGDDDDDDRAGLSFDSCLDDSECAGSRTCREISDEVTSATGDPCTPDAEQCTCIPTDPSDIICSSDSDCDDGETCFEIDGVMLCATESGASFLRELAVCIASESLTHFDRKELTFEQDALAHVLCDMNESCATPGHMVVYRGEPLMMKNYCEAVGCTRKVKRVNSPKYVRKLVVPSNTQDLVFTALAARFETVAEENVLSAAVRLGF